MGNAKVDIKENVVVKEYDEEDTRAASNEITAYRVLEWATPTLVDHGETWLTVERLTPILEIPKEQSLKYKKPLYDLLQSVHDSGYWHGDCTLVNVVVCPRRGPLLIDWENLTQASGDLSYDLHGAGATGVPEIWPIIGGDGVSWNGPWDTCPANYWRNV